MEPSSTGSQLASTIFEVFPLVMRLIFSEMRQAGQQGQMGQPQQCNAAPAHFRMLGMLSKRPFSLTDLAEHQAVSLPTISSTVTTLEERGWVTRTRSTEDRRVVMIDLTEEGRGVLKHLHERALTRLGQLLDGLTEEQQTDLIRGLDVLRGVVNSAIPVSADSG
jgi:DNA-binding MarR family transcriptional regulator